MMSDWFGCFFFTEGVRGFPCLFLMIVFHGLACIFLWSFATAIYGKPKCNSVHYLHNLVVNLVLILVILFYCIYSVQSSYVHCVQYKKIGSPKMWNLHMESRIWIMKRGLKMESRIKQDCSSKVKITRTLSSDSILVFVLCVVWCKSSPLCLYNNKYFRRVKREK